MSINPKNRKRLDPHHKTQSQKVLNSFQNHKLLFSVNELQTPVFKQVHSILNKVVHEEISKAKSSPKIPKFKYL